MRSLTDPAAPPASRTIYIDVTANGRRGVSFTGIERIEYMLGLNMHRLAPEAVRFVAWNTVHHCFIDVSADELLLGTFAWKVSDKGAVLSAEATSPWSQTRFEPGACFFVIGYMWMQSEDYIYSVLRVCEHLGLRYCQLIHDLIPALFPHWHAPGERARLDRHLASMLPRANALVCYSRFTRGEILKYAASREMQAPDPTVIRLGDAISEVDTSIDHFAAAELFLDGRPFVLNVASFSPRKNHQLLYHLWVRLVEDLGAQCPPLVIVGSGGWQTNELKDLFKRDPRLSRHVVLMSHLTDKEVDWLYRKCLFTVFPTFYEGWGMPVGESLAYGKFCIASDVASVPEIGPGLVDLLDPLDFATWYARVRFYITSREAREAAEARIAAHYSPTPWSDAATDVLAALEAAPGGWSEDWRLYYPGTPVALSDPANARYLVDGWGVTERFGRWSVKETARLRLRIAPVRQDNLLIDLDLRRLRGADDGGRLSIQVNGRSYGTVRLGTTCDLRATLTIPFADVWPSGDLDIALTSSHLTVPAEIFTGSGDERQLGIGLVAFQGRFASAAQRDDPFPIRWQDPSGERRPEPVIRALGPGKDLRELHGWGVYQPGPRTLFEIPLDHGRCDGWRLELDVRPVASAQTPLALMIYVNRKVCGFRILADPTVTTLHVDLPDDAVVQRPLQVALVSKAITSPHALEIGRPEESFAVGLFEARLLRSDGDADRREAIVLRAPLPDVVEPIGGNEPAGRAVLLAGWHSSEGDTAWTRSPDALLRLEADRPAIASLALESWRAGTITVRHPDAPEGTALPPDGQLLLAVTPDSPQWIGIGAPAEMFSNPFLDGVSIDDRWLGVRLRSLTVDPAAVLTAAGLSFAADGDGVTGLTTGWDAPDETGVRLRQQTAIISLLVAQAGEGQLVLDLSWTPSVGAEMPVTIALSVNGGEPLVHEVWAAGRLALPIPLPPTPSLSGALRLHLDLGIPASEDQDGEDTDGTGRVLLHALQWVSDGPPAAPHNQSIAGC